MMKWFKHDSDAFMDAKLKKLKIRYGMEGYGLYWYCLEIITAGVDQYNLNFELEHDAEIIAHDTGLHFEHVQEIMEYMVKLKLFENTNGHVTCLKLLKRLDQSMTSNAGLRKRLKNIHSHDPVMTKSSQNRIEENRTEENRTEQNRININKKKFTPPTIQEIQNYLTEKNITTVSAEHFFNHYEANGWIRGKTKIKNWQACVKTWVSNTGVNSNGTHKKTRGQRVNEALDKIAFDDIQENGYVDSLDNGDF